VGDRQKSIHPQTHFHPTFPEGSVIIFTALLSIFFLRDRLPVHKWVGVGAVFAGLFIVGASDYGEADTDPRDMHVVIVGDLFIVLAQIVVATQMVLEQKYLRLYDVPPLVTVGLEGWMGKLLKCLTHIT